MSTVFQQLASRGLRKPTNTEQPSYNQTAAMDEYEQYDLQTRQMQDASSNFDKAFNAQVDRTERSSTRHASGSVFQQTQVDNLEEVGEDTNRVIPVSIGSFCESAKRGSNAGRGHKHRHDEYGSTQMGAEGWFLHDESSGAHLTVSADDAAIARAIARDADSMSASEAARYINCQPYGVNVLKAAVEFYNANAVSRRVDVTI